MSFFEVPPPRSELPEPEEYGLPEWMGAPSNVLGVAVPIRLVLARTEDVAVAVTDATALIRDAGTRAELLWDEPGGGRSGGSWTISRALRPDEAGRQGGDVSDDEDG